MTGTFMTGFLIRATPPRSTRTEVCAIDATMLKRLVDTMPRGRSEWPSRGRILQRESIKYNLQLHYMGWCATREADAKTNSILLFLSHSFRLIALQNAHTAAGKHFPEFCHHQQGTFVSKSPYTAHSFKLNLVRALSCVIVILFL